MKVLSLILSVVCLVTVSGFTAGAQTQITCTFPGAKDSCSDPQGRWAIEWVEPSGNGKHALWLKTIPRGTRTKLLEFDRSVDLLWAPNGRALAVTDHAGSSNSVLWVFTGSTLTRAVNVEDRLQSSLGKPPAIYTNGHRYFEAVRWLNPDALQFRVRAYDSEPGTEYVGTFCYDLDGRVRREPCK